MSKKGYFAGRSFLYNETALEAGQLFDPRGAVNDAILISNGYLKAVAEEYPTGSEDASCSRCAKTFVDQRYLLMHESKCPDQELELAGVGAAESNTDIQLPGEEVTE